MCRRQAAEKCTLAAIKSPPLSGWEVRDGDGNLLRDSSTPTATTKSTSGATTRTASRCIATSTAISTAKRTSTGGWERPASAGHSMPTKTGASTAGRSISPEEVSEELIAALSTRDAERFRRLLLTEEELQGSAARATQQATELGKKIADATAGIEEFVRSQEFVNPKARWVNFGGTRPGVVPAGTDGLKQDLQVYENAVAVIEVGGRPRSGGHRHADSTGDAWRLIDLPRSIADTQNTAGPTVSSSRDRVARREPTDDGRRPAG